MAPFPYLPMVAILLSLVSYVVVQNSVYSYAGYMVGHLGVVDDKNQAGETRLTTYHDYCLLCILCGAGRTPDSNQPLYYDKHSTSSQARVG